eukprot:SM000024S07861  [mRNA]  locus=s24:999933:1009593:+ [translate_table: standard]
MAHSSDGDSVFDISAKKPAAESLMRWRQATLALNATRRFRYTAKLQKDDEGKPVRDSSQKRFRRSANAALAIQRFRQAGVAAGSRRGLAEPQPQRPITANETPGLFDVTREQLSNMLEDDESSHQKLDALGGVPSIVKAVQTDTVRGIGGDAEELAKRKLQFGDNTYLTKPPKSFLAFVWDAAKDKTLIILAICAVVSLAAGLATDPKEGWYDGISIVFAVVLVILVTATSDYRQSLQFRDLDAEKKNIQVQVVRDGRRIKVSIYDLVVGDVVPLAIGDQVPGDGLLLTGHSLTIDESSMTGESDYVISRLTCHMMIGSVAIRRAIHETQGPQQTLPAVRMQSCRWLWVNAGEWVDLITSVGMSTEWGRLMATISDDNAEETPLQVRLNGVATQIGKYGLIVAVLVFVILFVRYFADFHGAKAKQSASSTIKDVVDIFTVAVTIVVVAVPEGLPLAVTLTLAYSMRKMMADKALVRKLAACETMGSATAICSDKTGTLTLNEMTVIKSWTCGCFRELEAVKNIPQTILQILLQGIAQNTNGSVFKPKDGGEPEITASPTEAAVLKWGVQLGMDFEAERAQTTLLAVESFNSAKKRAGVAVRLPNGEVRLHWKGAAEIVLDMCSSFVDQSGEVQPLTGDKIDQLKEDISTMASACLRCLALATRTLSREEAPKGQEDDLTNWILPDSGLTLLAIVGMKAKELYNFMSHVFVKVDFQDPTRPGVPEAVAICQRAGVKVRMVTGDNVVTARAIAQECGILTPNGIAIEGRVFRALSPQEMRRVIPTIDVMARSSPTDKHTLVKMLRQMGEVVGVTGDGTNDAPALHEADIGLAMGISGTEVAKEASDIIILDDNFASIVVRWGRAVYVNIQKFLQFQLTVNLVALVINFVAAVGQAISPAKSGVISVPLNAVQLLWINLIMDTLGALALATEKPTDELMERKPVGRREPLITNIMIRNLLGQAIYQLAICLTLNYAGKEIWNLHNNKLGGGSVKEPMSTIENNTVIFNVFVFMQVFNEISARDMVRLNVFKGILKNRIFCTIIVATVGVQILLVEVGFLHKFATTTSLDWQEWLFCVVAGVLALPLAMLVKLIPVPKKELFATIKTPRFLKFRKKKMRAENDDADAATVEDAATNDSLQDSSFNRAGKPSLNTGAPLENGNGSLPSRMAVP